MCPILQFLLDRAEDFATERHWVGVAFQILSLKRRLGLNYWR